MKRARTAGRRMFGVSNQGQTIRSVPTGRRRISRRSYRRSLYNYSLFMPKFRCGSAGNVTMATPAQLNTYNFQRYQCIPTLFTASTWADSYDTATIPTSIVAPVFVRGGVEKLTISSEANEQIDYKVMLVWVKKRGTVPAANTNVSKGFWMMDSTIQNEMTRVVKQWEGTLTYQGGSATFVYRPKMKVYKSEFYSSGSDCMYWYIFVGNTVDAAAVNVIVLQDSSVTVGYIEPAAA